MAGAPDDFALESIAKVHGLACEGFIPYVIIRSRNKVGDTSATWRVLLRNLEAEEEVEKELRVSWSLESIPLLPPAIQPNLVTECAALGMACIVIWKYAAVHLRSVAIHGQGFDFWGWDGELNLGVEVGGTIAGDLEDLHREKVRQLLRSPEKVDGYVVAVEFASRTVIVSFNRYVEGTP